MSSFQNERIRTDSAALGMYWVHPPGGTKGHWEIKCSSCDHVETRGWVFNMPVEQKVSKMVRAGWRINAKEGAHCPACVDAATEERRQKMVQIKNADPKIARRVYQELDEHFDEPKRLYKGKESDKTIAVRIGTAEAVVASIREEAYGKLAASPALVQIQQDIALLKTSFDNQVESLMVKFDQEMSALKSRLDVELGEHKAGG